ncbi:MAG TPA: Ig-like domain-containing protein [Vicinamibacterales bacterium]|nr:Ig-like domain-containing protein [Vicinamibacterales bacterium]
MKRAALILALFATTVLAQQATRRPTDIAALKQYPSFFHNRPILLVGTVATTDKGIRVSDDNGSFPVLFKGSAPDGLDEIRGEFWDIGRMKPDEPQLTSYDLRQTFGIDPNGPWPRPGEVTAIVATNISQAVLPTTPSIRSIVLYPSRFVDQKVTITGQFGGRNLFGDLPDAPGKSRYDFVLRASDSAIWVSGAQPKGKGFNFSLDSRLDSGRWLEVTGIVKTGRGLEWIDVAPDGLQLGKAPTESAPVETEQVRVAPAPRPEVVFSAPTQDETDVSMSIGVRIQFSRDINASTLKNHIKVRYLDSQTTERGEPTTPTAEFTTRYLAPTRVLELHFTKPLERFRTVHIDLTDEILGTDKQPLQPWTLSFDTGGN